ncbi:GH32 C-terminal domain-containing protein [Pseudarthrobacter sp. NPDC058119]|uniref:GH32 C-terminal domain-containing protein n=1 Tax=Pseudarthrobacter sp. NPDC058119 TaxID=3346348 RepID=UPI0036DF102F
MLRPTGPGFHETFPSTSHAPIAAGEDGNYTLQIFIDQCSVEVFANDGLVAVTELIFPEPGQTSFARYSTGGTADAVLQLTNFGKDDA